MRSGRPRSPCRCARLDVRTAQGTRHVEAAGRARLASRYPAHGRQIRRRVGHARRARSGAHPQRCRDRDGDADLHLQLDQRRRLAFCAGDDGIGRLCRRLHHRQYPVAQGCRGRHGWRSARQHRLSRRDSRSAPRNSRASSNFISSRVPFSRPRTRPSAWSIPVRACCGTTARSLDSKAMPARRRCRCAAMRWRHCRKSCWRWKASRKNMARRRSAPLAKP